MTESFRELCPVLEQVQLVPGLTTQPTVVASQQCFKCQSVSQKLQITIYWVLEPWGFFQTQESKGSTLFRPHAYQLFIPFWIFNNELCKCQSDLQSVEKNWYYPMKS